MGRAFAVAIMLMFGSAAWAKEAPPAAQDPQLEARMMAIAAALRCPVCQNQTIADSDADLAKDLRNLIREKLQRGESERQIVDYMIARYGDFVLWRPPLIASTLLLWIGPALLAALGLFLLFYRLWRERGAGEIEFSEAEHARAALLLQAGAKVEER